MYDRTYNLFLLLAPRKKRRRDLGAREEDLSTIVLFCKPHYCRSTGLTAARRKRGGE